MGLLLRNSIAGGERSRVGLAESLNRLRQFQGVGDVLNMNEQRELTRPLTPFMVKESQIVTWNPSFETTSGTTGTEKQTGPKKKTLRR